MGGAWRARRGGAGELELVAAFEAAKRATDAREIVRLVEQHDLPRECVPTEWLNDARVWEALLEQHADDGDDPQPRHDDARRAARADERGDADGDRARCATREKLAEARIHPIAVLAALKTYAAGRGVRGQHTWTPVAAIVDALDDAFYATFEHVEPSGKRTLAGARRVGLDGLRASWPACRA